MCPDIVNGKNAFLSFPFHFCEISPRNNRFFHTSSANFLLDPGIFLEIRQALVILAKVVSMAVKTSGFRR